MELSALKHIEPERLSDFEADLFITSLGYESRSINISRFLENLSCRKVALADSRIYRGLFYDKNRAYYTSNGFGIVEVESDYPDFSALLKNGNAAEIRLIVDCTSMSRNWYYELFRWFSDDQDAFTSAVIRLVYSMASYVDPGPPLKMRQLREFTGSESSNGKKKKKALLLGLGHEQNISESIYKAIGSDLLYLYYADPPADKQFVEKLFVNNHTLINTVPIRNLIAYPIRNGQQIYQELIDTILPLRNEYAIHMVPLGPKIFSVASMLVHFSYPDTIISYPELKKSVPSDRQSNDKPVVMDIHFEVDD